MPRLPSFPDVGNVSPTIVRDPGVSAPVAAFQSPIGIAAQELAPALQDIGRRLRDAEVKQNNRRDTVDSASRTNHENQEFDAELRRLNTEDDLSEDRALTGYGQFMEKRIQKALEGHQAQGASPDSIARLTIQLEAVRSQAIGRASAISTKLGRDKVGKAFDSFVTPLAQRAAAEPTLKNIDASLQGLETQIQFLKGAIDPTEEDTFRQRGREHIALSAVDSLVSKGRVEQAASLLEDGNLISALVPETQRQVRGRIETVRFARDEALRTIAAAEAVAGRPLTPEEKLQTFGIKPPAGPLVINQMGEAERSKAEGAAMAKVTVEQLPNLRRQRGQLQAMESLIDRGTETGGFKQLQLNAANFFGTTPESLSDLAAFRSVSNAATLSKTAELKGAISEKELVFVQESIASSGTGTQANKAILRIQSKLIEREIDSLRLMANYHATQGTLNGFDEFLQTWADVNPLFSEGEQQEITRGMAEPKHTKSTKPTGVPLIQDQAEYDKLPLGTRYTTGDGKTRIKRQ